MDSRIKIIFVLGLIILVLATGGIYFKTKQSAPQNQAQDQNTVNAQLPVSEQYEITEKDNGKTFFYNITSGFSLILDQKKYPGENISVICQPDDTIGKISNISAVAPPLYTFRFKGVNAGSCIIKDGNFAIKIQVVDQTVQIAHSKISATDSGIIGKAILGPTCPVVRIDQQDKCADKPYKTTILIKSEDGTKEIKRVKSDETGRFMAFLPPGTYQITRINDSGALYPIARPITAKVRVKEFLSVVLNFDTGIR